MNTSKQRPIIVVTGSAGLIGSRVCQRLADRSTVIGLDIKRPEEGKVGQNAEWIKCDFTSDDSVRNAFAEIRQRFGGTIVSVIHLAAYYDFSGDPSPLYQELTIDGTRRLLNALHSFEMVEQLMFSSSLLVMKPCDLGETLTEDSPVQAEWEYPKSKLAAEQVIRDEHGTIPALILRLAGVYDEQGHSLPITQNIRRIAEKDMESYFFPGDADRGQAFVHLDDVVNCVERAVRHRHELELYETLLIAEDECISYRDLQDLIGEYVHGTEDWPTIRIPKFVAKTGAWVKEHLASSDEQEPFIKPWMVDLADAHYPVDSSKARQLLGWKPTHRLSAVLPVMIENLKQNPRQWYLRNHLPLPTEGVLAE